MTTTPNDPSRRRLLLATASLGAGGVLAACGGGGSDAGTPGTGGSTAGSFTAGPISGFGSVIVGGIRFDDSTALVVDEDGASKTRADLKLGVLVDVDAGTINRAELRAVALRFALGGLVKGPLDAVDAANSTLTVLGQTVLVTTSTVFDDGITGGLAGLAVGNLLEVYGLYDPANRRFVATRIERETALSEYRIRGVIGDLDTAARTFKIGPVTINYATAATAGPNGTPSANGQFVRVWLQTTASGGVYTATGLRVGWRGAAPAPCPEARVEGTITALRSTTDFDVNGVTVDARSASFPDGTAGIVLGARVEVSGAVSNGVLVADKVEIEERRNRGERPLEFRGEISRLDTTAKTFALRGLTIWYGGTVAYRNGSEATLADGRRVEVRGVISADRVRIEARRIEFS